MPRSRAGAALAVLATLLLGACDSATSPPTRAAPESLSLDLVSGGAQTGFEFTQLVDPIVFRLVSSKGKVIKGQVVSFRVVQGGGSVWAGASVSDANGLVKDWWTLGSASSRNLLEARAIDPTTGDMIVLGSLVIQPVRLVDPVIQCKFDGQADWVPASAADCGFHSSIEPPPSLPNGTVVNVAVRAINGDGTPIPGFHLDFYGVNGSTSPAYGLTDALGLTSLQYTIGPEQSLSTLEILNEGSGAFTFVDFKAGY